MDIRVCTLCSGYDSQMMALRRIKYLNADLVYWSEIDPNAIKAHNLLFPEYENRNLGDMTAINWEDKEDFDLLTYSTPCTSLSCAGKRDGMKKDSNTESSIIWSVEDCIRIKRPKYLIMENVKNILGKRFKEDFLHWCKILEEYGYTNFYNVLNARHYGIPQNRERLYMISILNCDKEYVFPKPYCEYTEPKEHSEYKKPLYEILEDISNDSVFLKKDLVCPNEYQNRFVIGALRARSNGDWHTSPHFQKYEVRSDEYTNTLTSVTKDNVVYDKKYGKFRYLTERENFRLMDVDEEYIDLILNDKSIKKKVKLAGNSIVVSVLEEIMKSLFT